MKIIDINTDNIALHWGLSCGNGIIEGIGDVSAVQVPASVCLFGSGLLGLVGIVRRKAQ